MENKTTSDKPQQGENTSEKEATSPAEQELKLRTHQIDNIFLSSPGKKMFDEVLDVVIESVKSKYGAFGYMDEDGSVVVPAMSKEVWLTCRIPFKTYRFPPGTWTGIWIPALTQKKAHYSNEPKNVPAGHVKILKCMIAPIIYQGEVIGHFEVANKPTDYTDADLELLKQLADHVAPMLYSRLQKERGN